MRMHQGGMSGRAGLVRCEDREQLDCGGTAVNGPASLARSWAHESPREECHRRDGQHEQCEPEGGEGHGEREPHPRTPGHTPRRHASLHEAMAPSSRARRTPW